MSIMDDNRGYEVGRIVDKWRNVGGIICIVSAAAGWWFDLGVLLLLPVAFFVIGTTVAVVADWRHARQHGIVKKQTKQGRWALMAVAILVVMALWRAW